MSYMMYLKVTNYRISRKIFSMCKTEYAKGYFKYFAGKGGGGQQESVRPSEIRHSSKIVSEIN